MTNLEESLPKELLRTNRSGAYSCSTIVECNTRKYHGLLVVPVPQLDDENHVLLSSLDVTVIQHGAEFNLGLHKYQGNNFSPKGHKYIREFDCDKVPTTLYRVGGVILKREVVFQHYEDRILIRYTLVDAHSATTLRFRPFLAFRSVRPNMIFPVAFDYSPLNQEQKKAVLDICTRELLTPKGLRTLSPKSGGYNPMYVGPQSQRDYAYHQGTAWPWLGGFYMEACLRLYKRTRLSFIERQMVGYEDEMYNHCIGTIPELFDGNPPFRGRGGISFAMNVAEILRTMELLEKYSYK